MQNSKIYDELKAKFEITKLQILHGHLASSGQRFDKQRC